MTKQIANSNDFDFLMYHAKEKKEESDESGKGIFRRKQKRDCTYKSSGMMTESPLESGC